MPCAAATVGTPSSTRVDLSASLGSVILVIFVGPLSRVRPRNGILGLVVVVVVVVLPLRSEFIGEL